MPAATVTCPHCEKPVEIQVTAVTRSRSCPNCAQTIMLQVAGRANQLKHKALLMSPKPPTDQFAKPEFIDESTLLPGDAFDRMCQDPELIRTRKQFMMGAVVVCMASLLAAVVQLKGLLVPGAQPEITKAAIAETTPLLQPDSLAPVPLVHSPQIKAEALKNITFRPANAEEGQGTEKDVMQTTLELFLAAPTVDEKLMLVNDSAGVESAMRSYYQNHQAGALAYSHIERHPGNDVDYTEFRVVMRDGTKRFAAVVSTPEGPRVDWASFVAHGDLEWEQMRKLRPARPVLMRVLAARGNQYSGAFSNTTKLRCIRLVPAADPSAAPVFGYVPLDSEIGRQLGGWLGAGDNAQLPLTLKICYPQEVMTHDQAWISELVATGWVTTPPKSTSEGE